MTSPFDERWAEVELVLDRVLDAGPSHRAALVREICAGDAALRRKVERLLQASAASAAFLATPASAYAAPLLARLARNQVLDPGDRLGPYLIERELGRGGMAMVYLARDSRHDRAVALKVLLCELAGGIGPGRFLREIRLAARLTHPYILRPYDSGRVPASAGTAAVFYYAMPFIGGGSLRARLSREHRLAVGEAVSLACEVADALDYAHRQGVVHRDVKPENILLRAGHAMVADFGIARALELRRAGEPADGERLTGAGVALGTPLYMSPEQSTGDADLDGRTDLYSLACVLFEMLTGAPPFTGGSSAAALLRRRTEPPPPVRELRPEVPSFVEAALSRALSPVPAGRQRTGAELSGALRGGTVRGAGPRVPYARAFRPP